MQFNEIIKEVRRIIGDFPLKIEIFSNDELCFSLYETAIPITVMKNKVYIESALCEIEMDAQILSELADVAQILENNLDVIFESIFV